MRRSIAPRQNRIAACVLGLVITTAALGACTSEKSVVSDKSSATGDTVAAIDSIPDLSIPDLSIPDLSIPGVSIPDINSPSEALDFVIQQMELAGVKVDRDCVEKFLEDSDVRKQIDESDGQLPPALLQSFFSCISQ